MSVTYEKGEIAELLSKNIISDVEFVGNFPDETLKIIFTNGTIIELSACAGNDDNGFFHCVQAE